jgi:hypothetical protein
MMSFKFSKNTLRHKRFKYKIDFVGFFANVFAFITGFICLGLIVGFVSFLPVELEVSGKILAQDLYTFMTQQPTRKSRKVDQLFPLWTRFH